MCLFLLKCINDISQHFTLYDIPLKSQLEVAGLLTNIWQKGKIFINIPSGYLLIHTRSGWRILPVQVCILPVKEIVILENKESGYELA